MYVLSVTLSFFINITTMQIDDKIGYVAYRLYIKYFKLLQVLTCDFTQSSPLQLKAVYKLQSRSI